MLEAARASINSHQHTPPFHRGGTKNPSLAAHLGWARLVIDRTKEHIKYPDARHTQTPGRAKPLQVTAKTTKKHEAHEHENCFNPDPGFSAAAGYTAQC